MPVGVVQVSVQGPVSLVPEAPFQVEADVPETDIGKISFQDRCQITLDAFPEKKMPGQVIEIEPAETVIQGVVYYRIKVSLESGDENIRPGMTAEVDITTASKENVLVIPQRAVSERNGYKTIKFLEDNKVKEKEIETGIRSVEGQVEVISGLNEGEEIITYIKD